MNAFRSTFCKTFHSKLLAFKNNGKPFSSTKTPFEESDIQVSVTSDGQTVVCLHRQPDFPYEHTKPLPQVEDKFVMEDSVLKLECRRETDDILFNKDYSVTELMQMTYTGKYPWFPTARWKRRKPNIPIPRPGI